MILDGLCCPCAIQDKVPEGEEGGLLFEIEGMENALDRLIDGLGAISELPGAQRLGIVVDALFCEAHEVRLVLDGGLGIDLR